MACLFEGIKGILITTDGSEFCEGAEREAIGIAKSCSAKLYAVSVVETNPEYESIAPHLVEKEENRTRELLESLKARASSEGVDCETIARRNEQPFQSIIEEAEKRRADFIVTGRRGRSGIRRLLMGSVTAKVIGHAPCNVLVVPKAAKIEGKSILVATDGSKYSEAASTLAVKMAKSSGVKLHVISVIPSETIHPLEDVGLKTKEKVEREMAESETKRAEESVKAVKEIAQKEGVSVSGVIYTGRPYEAILKEAKGKVADIIVMGSHGRTGLGKLLMGSVAERVIGLSECAVLVVKG